MHLLPVVGGPADDLPANFLEFFESPKISLKIERLYAALCSVYALCTLACLWWEQVL
jgi:hypothetical protein